MSNSALSFFVLSRISFAFTFLQPFCNQPLPHSFSQRRQPNSNTLSNLRTLLPLTASLFFHLPLQFSFVFDAAPACSLESTDPRKAVRGWVFVAQAVAAWLRNSPANSARKLSMVMGWRPRRACSKGSREPPLPEQ